MTIGLDLAGGVLDYVDEEMVWTERVGPGQYGAAEVEGRCSPLVWAKVAGLHADLVDMVRQFAPWSDKVGGFWTGGLSTLESAFATLGWDDPHADVHARCDEPTCLKQATCGTPTPTRYRWTCFTHIPKDRL